MGSLLRRVKERKKTRRLGEVEVMEQEGYGELEVDSKVEMIRALVPLGLMHVHELLDAEVSELAGERYVRKSETVQGRRHGTNPGTVKLAGQRVPVRVPRVRGRDGEIPLNSYAQGNTVQKRDAMLPGERPGSRPEERWTSRRLGPHLDQNVLGQLRRGSPGLDSGPLGWPLFRCRRARSAPAPLFGANVSLENPD